jgi:DNA-binding PadR family transcriptional regulator
MHNSGPGADVLKQAPVPHWDWGAAPALPARIVQTMDSATELRLSRSEWVVLCLVCERPSHGFAIASSLARDSDFGQIWHVQKAVVYRAMDRLESLGLIRTDGLELSNHGPVRWPAKATVAGRGAARSWLTEPAAHPRDIRTELLIKLALLHRSGDDATSLLREQRAQLLPIVAGIESQFREAAEFDRTLAAWRRQSIAAALEFLDAAESVARALR